MNSPIERLHKAERLLAQAQAIDVDEAPEAVAHLAYYAMFHAAAAVLLSNQRALPKTHRGLIGEFGRLARDASPEASAHGRALNRAEDLRLLADYGASVGDLDETAAAARDDAKRFVAYCRSWIGPSGT